MDRKVDDILQRKPSNAKLYVSCLIGFVGLIKYALYSSEEEFNIYAFGA